MPAHALKLGLIGAGRIGSLHAEHLTTRIPAADLIMVADAFEEAVEPCAERYAIPFATQDYRDVLARPDIQAVVICSSTNTHAQIIEEAAWAGKHIFCEKPIKPLLPVAVPVVPQAFGAGVFAAARAVFKKPKHFVQNARQHVSGFRGISRASGSRIEQIAIRDAQSALIFIADSRDQPITRAQFTGIHVEDPACAERQRLGRCS